MAKSHYSADSAPLPPPRYVLKSQSDVTGPSTVPATDGETVTAGEAFPVTPSSVG
jgi:hypothetical protein